MTDRRHPRHTRARQRQTRGSEGQGQTCAPDSDRAALLRKMLELEKAALNETQRDIDALLRQGGASKGQFRRRQCSVTRISEIVRNGKSAAAVDSRVYEKLQQTNAPHHWRPATVMNAPRRKMLVGGQFLLVTAESGTAQV